MKQVILLRKSMEKKIEQHGGAEDGLWLTASEKLKPLVLELQGNDICQHLPLVEPLMGTQSWPTSWLNPCETLKHKTQLSHELLTHRSRGIINVSCFIWLTFVVFCFTAIITNYWQYSLIKKSSRYLHSPYILRIIKCQYWILHLNSILSNPKWTNAF